MGTGLGLSSIVSRQVTMVVTTEESHLPNTSVGVSEQTGQELPEGKTTTAGVSG